MITLYGFGNIFPEGRGETKDPLGAVGARGDRPSGQRTFTLYATGSG